MFHLFTCGEATARLTNNVRISKNRLLAELWTKVRISKSCFLAELCFRGSVSLLCSNFNAAFNQHFTFVKSICQMFSRTYDPSKDEKSLLLLWDCMLVKQHSCVHLYKIYDGTIAHFMIFYSKAVLFLLNLISWTDSLQVDRLCMFHFSLTFSVIRKEITQKLSFNSNLSLSGLILETSLLITVMYFSFCKRMVEKEGKYSENEVCFHLKWAF